jgi:DNA repair exonuclease SbcCD ATPase subunit
MEGRVAAPAPLGPSPAGDDFSAQAERFQLRIAELETELERVCKQVHECREANAELGRASDASREAVHVLVERMHNMEQELATARAQEHESRKRHEPLAREMRQMESELADMEAQRAREAVAARAGEYAAELDKRVLQHVWPGCRALAGTRIMSLKSLYSFIVQVERADLSQAHEREKLHRAFGPSADVFVAMPRDSQQAILARWQAALDVCPGLHDLLQHLKGFRKRAGAQGRNRTASVDEIIRELMPLGSYADEIDFLRMVARLELRL